MSVFGLLWTFLNGCGRFEVIMQMKENMRRLLHERTAEMLLGRVSLSDTVDALLNDITVDIYHGLYLTKDIREILHPYKRDYGHYF